MQVVTISFFRFGGLRNQLWAFSQMQFSRRPLRRIPGIGFSKLFGTGTRESFHPLPNFSVYCILATWPSEAHAKQQIAEHAVFQRYRAHSAENWTVYLSPVHSWGRWDGIEPFESGVSDQAPQPIGVLTRATVKLGHLHQFWKSVPDISDDTTKQDSLVFKMGMGEVPWVQQVTFSVWEDLETMRHFAYKSRFHRDAVKNARTLKWFKEELFARFTILDAEGHWNGGAPLQRALSKV